MATKIKITGAFDGPDFVRGLAEQTAEYTIVSSTEATLTFVGGFDPTTTYTQTLTGTGFGITDDGRYTGIVTASSASTRTSVHTGRSAISTPR